MLLVVESKKTLNELLKLDVQLTQNSRMQPAISFSYSQSANISDAIDRLEDDVKAREDDVRSKEEKLQAIRKRKLKMQLKHAKRTKKFQ